MFRKSSAVRHLSLVRRPRRNTVFPPIFRFRGNGRKDTEQTFESPIPFIPPISFIPPPPQLYYNDEYIHTLLMTNFSERQTEAREGGREILFSDEFSHQGYQLCLLLCPNGLRDAKGRFLSVYFQVVEGPNDASLAWPVKFDLKFTLEDRLEGRNHYHSKLPKFQSKINKPAERRSTYSRGIRRFYPLDQLEPYYLVDDSISVQVAVTFI